MPLLASRRWTRSYRRRSPTAALLLGSVTTVTCMLPAFLTGTMSLQLQQELAFGASGLGLAVGSFRATAALAGPWLGRVTDRLGAIRSLRSAATISAIASLGIVVSANRLLVLVVWLMLAGTAGVFAQTAANRLISNTVRPRNLGTAFGVKQSALPAASMLAGLSVPLVALTLGWRWSYAIAAMISLVVVAVAGPGPPLRPKPAAVTAGAPQLGHRRTLLLLTVGFGLATSSAAATTTFYIPSAVSSGTSAELAGVLLAVASVGAITTRLLAGRVSDRREDGHLRRCGVLLGVGSMGALLLATGRPSLMIPGVLVGIGVGWGFNGVFWFALMRSFRQAPGRLTGAVAPGGLLGGMLGPIGFGAVVDQAGYTSAWLMVAGAGLVAGVMLALLQRLLPTASSHEHPVRLTQAQPPTDHEERHARGRPRRPRRGHRPGDDHADLR